MAGTPEVSVDVQPAPDEGGSVEAMREAVTGRMTAEQAARDAEEARERAAAAQAAAGETGGVLAAVTASLAELRDQVGALLADREQRQAEDEAPTETVIAPVAEPQPAAEERADEPQAEEAGPKRVSHLLW